MERHLEQVQAMLGLFQSTMPESQLKVSAEAGEEMWEEIRKITDKYELNVNQMINATLALHSTIIEIAIEEMNKVKEGMNS